MSALKDYLILFFKGRGTRLCYEASLCVQEECNLNRKIVSILKKYRKKNIDTFCLSWYTIKKALSLKGAEIWVNLLLRKLKQELNLT